MWCRVVGRMHEETVDKARTSANDNSISEKNAQQKNKKTHVLDAAELDELAGVLGGARCDVGQRPCGLELKLLCEPKRQKKQQQHKQ